MASVLDVVTRAFRLIGVVAEDEPMTPGQSVAGKNAFNAMIAGWALRGVHTNLYAVELNDEYPLGEQTQFAVTRLLAAELAQEYGRQPPDTRRDWRNLAAAYMHVPALEVPRTLRVLPSQEIFVADS